MPEAPRASYAITAVVLLLLLVGSVLALCLQLAAALLTWPVLLCSQGRDRFHHIQSRIWENVLAFFCVGLNPFWCTQTHWVGSAAGLPEITPGSVIFCNHRSNVDPFLVSWLLSLTCSEARFVYKSSLAKIPILGWSCKLAGHLPVKFGDQQQISQMLDRSREILKQGYHLMIFPEGTRSPSGLLQDFKPSFFKICAELGCPAVPICLLGSERIWPHGGFRMGCSSVHVAIGEPLMPGPGGAEALKNEMAKRMHDMAREVLVDRVQDEGAGDDPLLSDRPYTYWQPPKELEDLVPEERLMLLRKGQAHERGARLA